MFLPYCISLVYAVQDNILLIQGCKSNSVFFYARCLPRFHWQGKSFRYFFFLWSHINGWTASTCLFIMFWWYMNLCSGKGREIQEPREAVRWYMVLCGGTHSWSHILWHVLGWETRLETYPTSNTRGWSPATIKP